MSIQPRGGKKGADFFILHMHFRGASNGNNFVYINSTNTLATQFSTTETARDMPSDFAFLVRRLRVTIDANSATGDTVIAFRVNAATPLGCSSTFATTVTGDTASTILSIPVQDGDLIDFQVNVTDAAANTVSGAAWVTCQRVEVG